LRSARRWASTNELITFFSLRHFLTHLYICLYRLA
jgi:hypothetical protein